MRRVHIMISMSQENIKGYYHDLLLLIQEVLPFSYEYVITDFSDGLQQLKDGQSI